MPTFHFLKYFTRRINYFSLLRIIRLEIKILMTTSLCGTYSRNTITFRVLVLQYHCWFKYILEYFTSRIEYYLVHSSKYFYCASPLGYFQYCFWGTYLSATWDEFVTHLLWCAGLFPHLYVGWKGVLNDGRDPVRSVFLYTPPNTIIACKGLCQVLW